MSHNRQHPLKAIFEPRTVAVVGATEKEGSVGRTILWNLMSSPFGATLYPVNPKRPNVMGIKAYPSIGDIPETVDLAVIVTPAPSVPPIVRECAAAGVRGSIVISAGFKEKGPEGAALEQEILEVARAGRIRIIGPNCLGVMNPITGMNATFATSIARPGNVAFISQSGALCTGILDWSFQEHVGFSSFVSIGSMLDVGWGDLIDYLGHDPRTQSIVIYMESIGDAQSFLSAAREVALNKPIIVIKAGATDAAAKAAASHTGSLTGSDEVLNAAFRRCGVLRVETISHLFYMAETLAKQPRPKGPNLTILTNAGGPGVLATDALISGGGKLTELSEETMTALDGILPPHWSHNNPIDILGDADAGRYAESLKIAAADPHSDGLLVTLTPQAMTDPTQTAQTLTEAVKGFKKPVLASWLGGPEVEAGNHILAKAGIPTFPYPDLAARIFNYMWRYSYNLRGLYETPSLAAPTDDVLARREGAKKIIEEARKAGRILLTEYESKQLLAQYGIPTVETRIATTSEEAVAAAEAMGMPVVLKLHSETITHKTDVGGVVLNLRNAESIHEAFDAIRKKVTELHSERDFLGVTVQKMVRLEGYEIILGSSVDPQFGPVVLFGSGGQLVEVFKDRALALPPLNTTLARRMMEQTKILTALRGVRGRKAVDLDALEKLVVSFGDLVVEQKWIKEIDINPLLASPEGLCALDARILLHPESVGEENLPGPVIRPYPTEYVHSWTDKQGRLASFRPIRPEDEPLVVKFHENISERSVYLRYFHPIPFDQRVTHERLARICFIDYNRQVVLVAEHHEGPDGREIEAIGRLNRIPNTEEAEFALLVSDRRQGSGIGTEMLRSLLAIAPREGIHKVIGFILPENIGMIKVCEHLGFESTFDPDEKVYKAVIEV